MGEQKRSLREFLRHVNDYTYRFDPEKGRFRYRELRGVRDTAFDFYMWLKCWKDMIVFVAKCPVSAVRALFRYQWFSTYLTYPNFVDRGTLGMRGNQLRMARAQYDRIVKKATDLLRISFVADEHFHPGNKLSKKIVLFDELVPGQIMAGFPNLIYLPAQVLPVFRSSTSRSPRRISTRPKTSASRPTSAPCPRPRPAAPCATSIPSSARALSPATCRATAASPRRRIRTGTLTSRRTITACPSATTRTRCRITPSRSCGGSSASSRSRPARPSTGMRFSAP